MRTIAVVARKGGSGKTTLAVHLAIAAHLSGRTTVIADTDPQESAIEVLKMRQGPGPRALASTPAGLLEVQMQARRGGADALLIDTPAGTEEGMSNAIVLCDLALLVIRPTFLDLVAAVHTADVLRRLRKPTLVVLNQAPVARDGVEPPIVKSALDALRVMRLPTAPTILRTRASYQATVAGGRSAVETAPSSPGGRELADLWAFIERFAFPTREQLLRRA
jgi:chromosome partitioning protein